ncbi:hypothetical protein PS9374_01817 [Planomonospora sphaerica]|uniref:Uncharacterized protein n=1 Tax=Planomonospora sphaerica TaxID=161355 RepID=A0A161M9P2_9ACTN|nr:hypothetical protein PS9374_01817 [Planomonospora sphaerica]
MSSLLSQETGAAGPLPIHRAGLLPIDRVWPSPIRREVTCR